MSSSSLIAELEDAVKNGSHEKRVDTLRRVANDAGREATGSRDFARSDGLVNELNRRGKLTEAALIGFITERKYEEMTATLALFCGAKSKLIERLLKNASHDGLIVACKAGKLTWP